VSTRVDRGQGLAEPTQLEEASVDAGETEAGDPVEIHESGPDEPRPTTRVVWSIR
jgi:hypothetical protein